MFGYVRAFKPEMKINEYDTYKAVYCGLCKQLGEKYGPFARLTLSYDFTFLSTLAMAVSEGSPEFGKTRCPSNPLKTCPTAQSQDIQSFSADCAMLMLYYKVQDDLHDKGFISKFRAMLLFPLTYFSRKTALKTSPLLDKFIAQCMSEQTELENQGTASVDMACEPTAKCLGFICGNLSDNPHQKRVLERLGYLVGRYVYLCDALDDIDDDAEKSNYNPFLASNSSEEKQKLAIGSLYMTIGEIAKTYELLTVYRYDSILANIIYLGLKKTVDQIVNKKENKSI